MQKKIWIFFTGTIKSIRTLRGEISIPPSKEVPVYIEGPSDKVNFLNTYKNSIGKLAKANPLVIEEKLERKPQKAISLFFQDIELYMVFGDLIDIDQEVERLKKELVKTEKGLRKTEKKLQNSKFLKNAPKEVVEKERARKEEALFSLESIKKRLEVFEKHSE
jgi:valyl-tRNA synthetase